MKFSDIKYFDAPSYRINVDWKYMLDILKDYETNYHLLYDPNFQRGYIWTKNQQIQYIEYILKGGVSGKEIYFNHPYWTTGCNKGNMILVDGKQRINAVKEFLSNQIKIFNHYYKEYTDRIPMFRGGFLFNINNLKHDDDVIKWYISMNSGGSIHTADDIKRAKNCIVKKP